MPIRDAFAQTQWFRLLTAGLVQSGIRHVVVSPGSRSTPLVCALTQHPALRLTVSIDERSAGFIALGISRATSATCVVVCTSGTAPAHYLPAVMEAWHSAIPLLVISADRPSELQANGSAQTTDQGRLFGSHVRAFFELGTPEARIAALQGLARKIAQGAAITRGPHPGPVHFNAQAFKPLEPVAADNSEELTLEQSVEVMIGRQSREFFHGVSTPNDATIAALAQRWASARKPLIFCGPSSHRRANLGLTAFATATGWPILAEITHPVRQAPPVSPCVVIDAFDLVARARPEELAPDLVVSIGGTPTSSAWLNWLSQSAVTQVHVVGTNGLIDPLNRAAVMIECDEEAIFEAMREPLVAATGTTRRAEWMAWRDSWLTANVAAKRKVNLLLASANTTTFTEAHVVAEVAKHVRPTDVVMFGNSLPIRVAETFFQPEGAFTCISQRGVSGIDGLIAGAIGSSIGTSARTSLVLGDVSAVHDLGSLRLLSETQATVVVVIIDNAGGRIFDTLPIAKQTTDLSPWTTPHNTAFDDVARAFGLAAAQVASRVELKGTLSHLPIAQSIVIWARVAPSGAETTYRELTSR
jgi:2-succinyl-5-enolpyruvyl-6-hydroxy-3-cyclohexene-1-carboxylate synthase